jgi:hypothetical protein
MIQDVLRTRESKATSAAWGGAQRASAGCPHHLQDCIPPGRVFYTRNPTLLDTGLLAIGPACDA